MLLSIAGQAIGADGTIEFPQNERTAFELLLQQGQVGDRLPVELFRDGELQQTELVLGASWAGDKLVPGPTSGEPPSYFIFGGMAFCSLTTNYLKAWREWWKTAPKHLLTLLDRYPSFEGERKVVLCGLMPPGGNAGYQGQEGDPPGSACRYALHEATSPRPEAPGAVRTSTGRFKRRSRSAKRGSSRRGSKTGSWRLKSQLSDLS